MKMAERLFRGEIIGKTPKPDEKAQDRISHYLLEESPVEFIWQTDSVYGGKESKVTLENRSTGVELQCENFRCTLSQLEILDLLSKGMLNKQIASYLGLSPATVKNQIDSCRKNNRDMNKIPSRRTPTTIELVIRAETLGFLRPDFLPSVRETFLVKRDSSNP